jgi:hypothetical protein
MREITKYKCEICGRTYGEKDRAEKCEATPIQHSKGVKVGDVVRITRGEGAGSFGKVTGIHIQEVGWGPSIYDHSVALVADVIDSWGTRLLTFDSYEVV